MTRKILWPVLYVCVPLAIIVGYLLATPDDFVSFGIMGFVMLGLSLPLLLRWHHEILIVSWNASLVLFFLPGRPYLWILMSCVTLFIAVLRQAMFRNARSYQVPLVTRPLLALAGVVLVTAFLRGGIGLKSLGGSTFGGKGYFYIFAAAAGYFALASVRIPPPRARIYIVLFFLSGLTALVSNLAYMAGPEFYFLYNFFPSELAADQALATEGFSTSAILRVTGLTFGCLAVFTALIAHDGLRRVLDIRRPLKLILLALTVLAGLFGGYRSIAILFALIFVFMFFLERLHRTPLFPRLLMVCLIGAVVVLPLLQKMPLSVQRALSFLPVNVDSGARLDAEASTQWRLDMWEILLPQIPQYFWKGKGYTIDPGQMYMAEQLANSGNGSTIDVAILSGNYHSGPLSVVIPFGVFGLLTFLWFLWAGWRVLYHNYRFGDPELKHFNTFLPAYYLAKTVFFFLIVGQLNTDLFFFTGLIGLSISLNGGMKKAESDASPKTHSPIKINHSSRVVESLRPAVHQSHV